MKAEGRKQTIKKYYNGKLSKKRHNLAKKSGLKNDCQQPTQRQSGVSHRSHPKICTIVSWIILIRTRQTIVTKSICNLARPNCNYLGTSQNLSTINRIRRAHTSEWMAVRRSVLKCVTTFKLNICFDKIWFLSGVGMVTIHMSCAFEFVTNKPIINFTSIEIVNRITPNTEEYCINI